MAARLVIIALALVIMALAAALGVALVGGGVGEGDLQARAIEVEIREEKIIQGDLEAEGGEIVTLRVTSDEPWLVELHGMEVEGHVEPGEVLLLPFEASTEGRFEIGLHHVDEDGHEEGDGGGDEEELVAGYIDILPK